MVGKLLRLGMNHTAIGHRGVLQDAPSYRIAGGHNRGSDGGFRRRQSGVPRGQSGFRRRVPTEAIGVPTRGFRRKQSGFRRGGSDGRAPTILGRPQEGRAGPLALCRWIRHTSSSTMPVHKRPACQPERVACYLRTSSLSNCGPDADSYSRQMLAIEGCRRSLNYFFKASDIFYDPGVSGTDHVHAREGFSIMLAHMCKADITKVVFRRRIEACAGLTGARMCI